MGKTNIKEGDLYIIKNNNKDCITDDSGDNTDRLTKVYTLLCNTYYDHDLLNRFFIFA